MSQKHLEMCATISDNLAVIPRTLFVVVWLHYIIDATSILIVGKSQVNDELQKQLYQVKREC